MDTTPAPGGTNHAAGADAASGREGTSVPRWTGGRLARWLVGLIATAAVLAAVGCFAWREHAALANVEALRATFPDIADRGWSCTDGAAGDDSGGYLVSCLTVVEDPDSPTVNFEIFGAPEPIEVTVQRRASVSKEMNDYNPSDPPRVSTLLGVEDWSPISPGQVWGSIARWHTEGDQAGLGPWFIASMRYDDHPYGVTAYASSAEELDEVIESLSLPTPTDLSR